MAKEANHMAKEAYRLTRIVSQSSMLIAIIHICMFSYLSYIHACFHIYCDHGQEG